MRRDGVGKLRRVEHVRDFRYRRRGRIGVELEHRGRATLPGLRLDDHDAVRRIGAVNRGRGRVPENGDVLDVGRIEVIERIAAGRETATRSGAHGDAVDDVERLAARADRRGAADSDREAAAGIVVIDDLHAGHLVLDQHLRADDPARIKLRVGHGRDRAGDVPRALLAIAGHDHFGQCDRGGGECEVGHDFLSFSHGDVDRCLTIADHLGAHRLGAGRDARDDVAAVGLG